MRCVCARVRLPARARVRMCGSVCVCERCAHVMSVCAMRASARVCPGARACVCVCTRVKRARVRVEVSECGRERASDFVRSFVRECACACVLVCVCSVCVCVSVSVCDVRCVCVRARACVYMRARRRALCVRAYACGGASASECVRAFAYVFVCVQCVSARLSGPAVGTDHRLAPCRDCLCSSNSHLACPSTNRQLEDGCRPS